MIHYVTGDATLPITSEWVIAHICNNVGAYNKGFAKAVADRYPFAKQAYNHQTNWKLGSIQIVTIEECQYVINMIAQDGLPSRYNPQPLSYTALEECLETVSDFCRNNLLLPGLSLHMPRIGTGLARGKWNMVEKIIQRTCSSVEVFVYDYVD